MSVVDDRQQLGLLTITQASKLAGTTPEGIARAVAVGKLRSAIVNQTAYVQRESLSDAILNKPDALRFPHELNSEGWLRSGEMNRGKFLSLCKDNGGPAAWASHGHQVVVNESRVWMKHAQRREQQLAGVTPLVSFYCQGPAHFEQSKRNAAQHIERMLSRDPFSEFLKFTGALRQRFGGVILSAVEEAF